MRLTPKIKERVRREFFPEDYDLAIQTLSRWRTRACAPWESPSRMHAAVLNLARGNLADLKRAIADAAIDFRDVLLWGDHREYKRRWCITCEAGEAVAAPEEEAFLQCIGENPTDNTARLIYADWLEERGDSRADYLRVLCAWLTSRSGGDQQLIERERELRATLGRGWLARVRGMPVREKRRKVDRRGVR